MSNYIHPDSKMPVRPKPSRTKGLRRGWCPLCERAHNERLPEEPHATECGPCLDRMHDEWAERDKRIVEESRAYHAASRCRHGDGEDCPACYPSDGDGEGQYGDQR